MKSALVSAILALLAATLVTAAPFALRQTFRHPNPDMYDGFGWSVALAGDNALVGAYCSAEAKIGSAFLFDPTTGDLLHTYTSPAPVAFDYFGWSVAAVGNNVLIGAYGDDTGVDTAGAAYLFNQAGDLLQTFPNPTPSEDDRFGFSVAAVGSNVLIGAPRDDTAASNAGAAYLFDGATGEFLKTFLDPQPVAGTNFGWSVAGAGGNALIGTYNPGNAAHLFDSSTGDLLHTLRDPTYPTSNSFGFAVAGVDGNALVSAPFDDEYGPSTGVVYLYDAISGELLLTLRKPAPQGYDAFGDVVTSAGTDILVGVSSDNTAKLDSGAIYLFEGPTGDLLQAILDPEPIIPDPPAGGKHWFGCSVSGTSDRLLAGAYGGNACSQGQYRAAYLFEPARPGDANLDQAVNLLDLAILANNWQQPAVWSEGDFNCDGSVNLSDLIVLANNWGAGGPQATVPEPAPLLLIAAGAWLRLYARAKKRR